MVSKPQQSNFFGEQQAANYDKQWAKLAPLRDAIHLLIRVQLSHLPDDARVLGVGVGTGDEVIYLAREFPGWSFALVEPSRPMLDVCRRKAEANGITARCTFHDGTLDSLPASAPFDAATCLLVSQFIVNREERHEFFGQIAERLRSGGFLISSDLCGGADASTHQALLEVWMELQKFNGAPAEMLEKMRSALGRDVAVLARGEIEELIASSGFEAPTQFYQTLLIHAWFARKNA